VLQNHETGLGEQDGVTVGRGKDLDDVGGGARDGGYNKGLDVGFCPAEISLERGELLLDAGEMFI